MPRRRYCRPRAPPEVASIAEMTEVKWITFQMGKREFPF
jgi:hypothetical protein